MVNEPDTVACISVTARIGVFIQPAILVVVILWPAHGLAGERHDVEAPTQIVDALHDALVEAARNSGLSTHASRVRQLESTIRNCHDFATMTRLVGGRFWKELSDYQRSRFIETFGRASIATYVSRFASAEEASFSQATLLEGNGKRVRVRSELVVAGGDRFMFEYVMHDDRDQWQIINILVNGVSDLALQRAELMRVYADNGFSGVMKYLEARVGGS